MNKGYVSALCASFGLSIWFGGAVNAAPMAPATHGSSAKGAVGAPNTLRRSTTAIPPLLRRWGITSLNPTAHPMAQNLSLPNQAAPVSQWWSAANPSLMLTAMMANSHNMVSLQPGQVLTLEAVWTSPDAAAASGSTQPNWEINSPDATISATPYASAELMSPTPPQTVSSSPEGFVASVPGVYVVRAQWDGTESMPLVITVGLNKLSSSPASALSMPPPVAGVVARPYKAVHADATDPAAMMQSREWNTNANLPTVWVGKPVLGWIPITGHVPASWKHPGWSRTVTVIISPYQSKATTYKSYVLPLSPNGSFSGIVASPWKGLLQVTLQASNYTAKAGAVASASQSTLATWNTLIQVNRATVLPTHLSSSAALDYSDPRFSAALRIAAKLWYNAPDPITGALAISNWVGDDMAYNFTEFEDSSWTVGATASQSFAAHLGVCQNFAQVLAGVYRGLGIPAVVEEGVISYSWVAQWTPKLVAHQAAIGLSHAWVIAYGLSAQPLVTDPTWDGTGASSLAQANFQTNAFSTDTTVFEGSHYAQQEETGYLP